MQLSQFNKVSMTGSLLMGLIASSWASPTPDVPLQKRDTTFARREETGVTDTAGQWTTWRPGFLSQ